MLNRLKLNSEVLSVVDNGSGQPKKLLIISLL